VHTNVTNKQGEYNVNFTKYKEVVVEKEDLTRKTTSLKSDVDDLTKRVQVLEEERNVAISQKRGLVVVYNETLDKIKVAHNNVVTFQNAISSRRTEISNTQSAHTSLHRELAELQAKHAALAQIEHDQEASRQLLEQKEAQERAELEFLQAEQAKEKAELERLKLELEEVKVKVSESDGAYENLKKSLTELTEAIKVSRDVLHTRESKLADLKLTNGKLKSNYLDSANRLQASQKRIAQLELKLAGFARQDVETEAKLLALASLEQAEQAAIEKSRGVVVELEGQLNDANAQLVELLNQVASKTKDIEDHKVAHKSLWETLKAKVTEIATQILERDKKIETLKVSVGHGKALHKDKRKKKYEKKGIQIAYEDISSSSSSSSSSD